MRLSQLNLNDPPHDNRHRFGMSGGVDYPWLLTLKQQRLRRSGPVYEKLG